MVDGHRRVVRQRAGSSFPIPGGASVVIPAGGARDTYGNTNPTLTGTLTGVVSGDGITASYTTTATAASHVTTAGYAITPVLNDPHAELSQ